MEVCTSTTVHHYAMRIHEDFQAVVTTMADAATEQQEKLSAAPASPMPVSPAPPSPAPATEAPPVAAATPPPPQPPAKAETPANKQNAAATPAANAATPKKGSSNPASAGGSPSCQSPVPSGGADSPAGKGDTFRERFKAFSKFGDTKSDGKHITLSQSDKWMKQAKVIDGKKITTTDTGIYFKKFKAQKIGLEDYKKFLEELAKNKKVDVAEIKNKMASCGNPGLTGVTAQSVQAAAVERLTDTSRYTGSHKQRFDESGKGRGLAGRKDVPDGSGYVQGYQNKDTYRKNR